MPAPAIPPVHPRWRGEQNAQADAQKTACGSSPLARGTENEQITQTRRRRFIPAGAGNRPSSWLRLSSPAVHPRWRGEQCSLFPPDQVASGSSPLARGTALVCRLGSRQARFIPAGAGNRAENRAARNAAAVHPRWRGEQAGLGITAKIANGSSPLARGTVLIYIIQRLQAVHPRWRGEQKLHHHRPRLAAGSSPLARGTGGVDGLGGRGDRFIPAGAGNSKCTSRCAPRLSVHPRWRGEQPVCVRSVLKRSGSSPLARGTAIAHEKGDRAVRFIPAGAGNSQRG